MKNNYSVCEQNLPTLHAKLARLNAKLAKINVPTITLTQVGQHDEPHPEIANALVRYVDVEVEGTTPVYNGWEFVATLVRTDDGNIIRAVPGYTVPVEFRNRPTWCDHCKCNRVRRDTYVVRHTDGSVKQVGSSCLEDFIGAAPGALTKAAEHLFNAYDICDAAQKREWLGGSNALNTYRIDLDTYLNHVAAVVLKMGRYITRKIAREQAESGGANSTATSDLAKYAMAAANPADTLYPITPEAEKLAADARAWVLNKYSPSLADSGNGMTPEAIRDMLIGSIKGQKPDMSDFEHNLLACARAEAIEPRLCGIAAYIIEAYRRSQPRPQAAQLNNVGLDRIFSMFAVAKEKQLKKPAIRLANEAGQHLHLSLAGAASKNAGFVYVKANSGFEAAYYGKISPEGRFFAVGSCPASVEPLLQSFANDPEGIATKYGRLTGKCCFCGRTLTDKRSTEVGYGKICAERMGLTWGLTKEQVTESFAHGAEQVA